MKETRKQHEQISNLPSTNYQGHFRTTTTTEEEEGLEERNSSFATRIERFHFNAIVGTKS